MGPSNTKRVEDLRKAQTKDAAPVHSKGPETSAKPGFVKTKVAALDKVEDKKKEAQKPKAK